MGRARASAGPRDNGDVRFAIDQFARWITNADTKAGLLGGALAVLAGAVGQQGRVLARHLPPGSLAGWASLLGLVVSASAVVTSIAFVVRAVAPTVGGSDRFSRYSWSSVADASIADLVQTDDSLDRQQGWLTAALLASIARRKFRSLRRAFGWWTLGALAFLAVTLSNLGR